jgi:hypothetical protein
MAGLQARAALTSQDTISDIDEIVAISNSGDAQSILLKETDRSAPI